MDHDLGPTTPDLGSLVERARSLEVGDGRPILGIAGAPGAGKSTLAERLAVALRARGVRVAVAPMDGFHLADAALEARGLRDLKGAPETFDAYGYAALLGRIANSPGHTIYAPSFHRDLEQPLAGAIGVESQAELVITEGNYLLLDQPPWAAVRSHLAEVWFCEVDEGARRQQLVARHVAFGKTVADAEAWVARVDEPNSRLVAATRSRADLVVAVHVDRAGS